MQHCVALTLTGASVAFTLKDIVAFDLKDVVSVLFAIPFFGVGGADDF